MQNYLSTVTVHPEVIDGRPGTLVIESFVVDVPEGNTKDETCYFVEALIKWNLKSLADVSERLAVQDRTEPIDRDWESNWLPPVVQLHVSNRLSLKFKVMTREIGILPVLKL